MDLLHLSVAGGQGKKSCSFLSDCHTKQPPGGRRWLSTLSLGVPACPWPRSISQPFDGVHHTRVLLCTARHTPAGTPRPALGTGQLLLLGLCAGALAPSCRHMPLPARHSQPGHAASRTTHCSSLVTSSPVAEFLCFHGPCRTGSQHSQLSGWWLTQQPTLWHVERLWGELWCCGLARTCQLCLALPQQGPSPHLPAAAKSQLVWARCDGKCCHRHWNSNWKSCRRLFLWEH